MGQLYLTNVDFLKNGVPASIIAMLVSHTGVLSTESRPFSAPAGCFDCWISINDDHVSTITTVSPPRLTQFVAFELTYAVAFPWLSRSSS